MIYRYILKGGMSNASGKRSRAGEGAVGARDGGTASLPLTLRVKGTARGLGYGTRPPGHVVADHTFPIGEQR